MLPPKKVIEDRKAIFSYLKRNPYSTIDEITKAMGLDGYYGSGFYVLCILKQLYNWGVLHKFALSTKNSERIKEFISEIRDEGCSEKEIARACTERNIILKKIEGKGLGYEELINATHASGLQTLEEALTGRSEEKSIILYKAKDGNLNELKFRLFNFIRRPTWKGGY